MTAAELARLEALRTTALAALTSARAVLQTVESMLIAHDQSDPAPDAAWDSFDATPPNATEVANGNRKDSKRR